MPSVQPCAPCHQDVFKDLLFSGKDFLEELGFEEALKEDKVGICSVERIIWFLKEHERMDGSKKKRQEKVGRTEKFQVKKK